MNDKSIELEKSLTKDKKDNSINLKSKNKDNSVKQSKIADHSIELTKSKANDKNINKSVQKSIIKNKETGDKNNELNEEYYDENVESIYFNTI